MKNSLEGLKGRLEQAEYKNKQSSRKVNWKYPVWETERKVMNKNEQRFRYLQSTIKKQPDIHNVIPRKDTKNKIIRKSIWTNHGKNIPKFDFFLN